MYADFKYKIASGSMFLLLMMGNIFFVPMGFADESYGVDRIIISGDEWGSMTGEEWTELQQALRRERVLNEGGVIVRTQGAMVEDEGRGPASVEEAATEEETKEMVCGMSDIIVGVTTTVCTAVLKSKAPVLCPLLVAAVEQACRD